MSEYRISGVWTANKVITHYAIHTVGASSTSRARKTPKSEAIELLEKPGNSAKTWVWNYSVAEWRIGEDIQVVNGSSGKYLRSNPDNKLTDNLGHLMDFESITS